MNELMSKRLENRIKEIEDFEFFGTYIPDYMAPGLARYIEDGTPPGSFLRAVLANDLMMAYTRADSENFANMRAYVGYLYNEAPGDCYGSPEKFKKWHEMGGYNGIYREAANRG